MKRWPSHFLVLCWVLGLVHCGQLVDHHPPAAATLSVRFDVKQARLSWTTPTGATTFRLYVNPGGVSGYRQLGDELVTTSYLIDLATHRVNWTAARYRVDACNGFGCTSSNEVALTAGAWQAIGYLKASKPGAKDNFGSALAVSADGSTLAVGADQESSGVLPEGHVLNSGAVYVFTRSEGTWSQQTFLKAPIPKENDRFGAALAFSASGNTLAVGSTGGAGHIDLFTRSGRGWSSPVRFEGTNVDSCAGFGSSLALSSDGDTLVAGVTVSEISTGACLSTFSVFTRNPIEGWLKYSPDSPLDCGLFPSVALSRDGNLIAIGSCVYARDQNANSWKTRFQVKADNAGDGYGSSVALSADGNTLAIGDPLEDSSARGVNGEPNAGSNPSDFDSGAVYLFTRNNLGWSLQAYLKASNTDSKDHFGTALALSADGHTLAVGAPLEDSSARGIGGEQGNGDGSDPLSFNSGAIYLFTRSDTGWSQQTYVKSSNTDPEAGLGVGFGQAIALTADGSLLTVGAPRENSSAPGVGGNQFDTSCSAAGAVYLY